MVVAMGLEVGAVALVAMFLALSSSLGHRPFMRQAAISLGFAMVAAPFLAFQGRRAERRRAWLRLGAPDPRRLGQVLGRMALAMVGIWLMTALLSSLPAFRDLALRERTLVTWKTPGELGGALLFIAAMPAFFEEIFFRGWLLHRLAAVWPARWAIVAQAILFAAAHGQAAPFALALGLLHAWLTLETGSLWPAMLLHFCNNLLVVLAAAK